MKFPYDTVGKKNQLWYAYRRKCNIRKSCLQLKGPVIAHLYKQLRGEWARVHTPCVCATSTMLALVTRYRISSLNRPAPVPRNLRISFMKELQTLAKRCKYHTLRQIHPEKVIERYDGAKREHYLRGWLDFVRSGYRLGRLMWDAMTKWGETSNRVRGLVVQVSRLSTGAISRLPILFDLSVRIPQEHALKKLRTPRGLPEFAVGMDQREIASIPVEYLKMGYFIMMVDAKSFDGSQTWFSKWERDILLDLVPLPHFPDQVKQVLLAQDRANLRSKDKQFKALLHLVRFSGTGGTAVGNKIVFYCLLRALLPGDVLLFCNGDDTLLIIPRSYTSEMISDYLAVASTAGLTITVDGTAYATNQVVFCRATPVNLGPYHVMIKNPADCLTAVTCIRRHFVGPPQLFKNYLHTVAVGFKALWRAVPVLCEFWRLIYSDGRVDRSTLGSSGLEHILDQDYGIDFVTDEARRGFAYAFGISAKNQLAIEAYIRHHGPTLATFYHNFGAIETHCDLDPRSLRDFHQMIHE